MSQTTIIAFLHLLYACFLLFKQELLSALQFAMGGKLLLLAMGTFLPRAHNSCSVCMGGRIWIGIMMGQRIMLLALNYDQDFDFSSL